MDSPATSFDDLPDPQETAILVRQARDGDDGALQELVARFQDRLLRIVRLYLGPRLRHHLESMDVVQAANQVFFRKVAELESTDPKALLQFLTTVVLNQVRAAHDHFHAQKRDVDRIEDLAGPGQSNDSLAGEGIDRLAANQTGPVDRVMHREARSILDDAVDRLPDDQRQVVVRIDYGGCDWSDVANELGRSEGAVRMLHKRAWDALKASLMPRLRRDDA